MVLQAIVSRTLVSAVSLVGHPDRNFILCFFESFTITAVIRNREAVSRTLPVVRNLTLEIGDLSTSAPKNDSPLIPKSANTEFE